MDRHEPSDDEDPHEHEEAMLDDVIEDSFPASDPPPGPAAATPVADT